MREARSLNGRILNFLGLFLLALAGLNICEPVNATDLLRWDRLDSAEIHSATITVTSSTQLELEVVNIAKGGFNRVAGYGWVVDGKTRDQIWTSEDYSGKRMRGNRDLSVVNDTLTLAPGSYDLYYFAAVRNGFNGDMNWKGDWSGVWDGIFWDADEITALAEDCYLSARSLSGSASVARSGASLPGALYSAIRVGNNERLRFGFELLKPMSIKLYTQIELPSGDAEPVDNCWIVRADSFERVWQATRRTTERGGGGAKNRRFFEDIPLQSGKYLLNYSTDDSHSAEGFNSQPPYDPNFWGVVLLPGANFDKASFRSFEADQKGSPLVDLTRIRDDEYREVPFTLASDAKVYIVALGEFAGGADEFADYAWITEARTNRIVWEMQEENTVHAGGASKNRMFEGVVALKAGSYNLQYTSDDSHSYRDWNSAEPSEPASWGVALFPPPGVDKIEGLTVLDEVTSHRRGYSKGSSKRIYTIPPIPPVPSAKGVPAVPPVPPISPVPPVPGIASVPSRNYSSERLHADGPILAAITRVRDDQERHQEFKVDKPVVVDIYAIGEGVGDEMADYGWIENAKTGRIIWEMDYFETRRAGGASKNRQVTTTLELPAGEYRLVYVTDGSHSFRNWNADPPRDEDNYGITLYLRDK